MVATNIFQLVISKSYLICWSSERRMLWGASEDILPAGMSMKKLYPRPQAINSLEFKIYK